MSEERLKTKPIGGMNGESILSSILSYLIAKKAAPKKTILMGRKNEMIFGYLQKDWLAKHLCVIKGISEPMNKCGNFENLVLINLNNNQIVSKVDEWGEKVKRIIIIPSPGETETSKDWKRIELSHVFEEGKFFFSDIVSPKDKEYVKEIMENGKIPQSSNLCFVLESDCLYLHDNVQAEFGETETLITLFDSSFRYNGEFKKSLDTFLKKEKKVMFFIGIPPYEMEKIIQYAKSLDPPCTPCSFIFVPDTYSNYIFCEKKKNFKKLIANNLEKNTKSSKKANEEVERIENSFEDNDDIDDEYGNNDDIDIIYGDTESQTHFENEVRINDFLNRKQLLEELIEKIEFCKKEGVFDDVENYRRILKLLGS